MLADREWSLVTDPHATLFIYIIEGLGRFNRQSDEVIAEKHAVLFNAGDTFWVKASCEGAGFLLMSGKPLKEPVAWGGPIVMNTEEELEQAFRELEQGKFIRHEG
ncbi:MAG: hypothetical protein M1319_06920 [Chloroflexi bacterium]|nr:hypothetical protein [Chloroflexota bacterium]